MILMVRPSRLILFALVSVFILAGVYSLMPGRSDRSAPDGVDEAPVSCNTCDARHTKLGERREAVRKLTQGND